jgi:hypothetical protein
MFRKGQLLCCTFCAVLSFINVTGRELFAQANPQGQTPGSTPFMSVPTNTGVAQTPAGNIGAGINYPETSSRTAGAELVPDSTQAGPNLSGSYYRSIPPSSLPMEQEKSIYFEEAWSWQLMPDSLLYQAYLAGGRESRMASLWIHEKDRGWMWDAALGGHVGILRYGTVNSPWPEGWQMDVEGAAFPRLNLEEDRDVDSVDFRFGIPLTTRRGPWQTKLAYYHISSHLGDEFMVRNHSLDRINYVRDCIVFGVGFFLNPDLRLYSEAGYGFNTDGGSQPWEFQFGIDYSPLEPTFRTASPFFAINGRIREEVDYGGNFTVQTGLQWRGQSGHLIRFGLQYFNGLSDLYQFFRDHEEQIGMGLWYDF